MFSTLQRPTLEELERRRAFRESMGIQSNNNNMNNKNKGLKRRESMLSRGFNAIFRKESFMAKQQHQQQHPHANGLNLKTATDVRRTNLSRAMSFKHPERISHMPPMEVTRIKSRSQHALYIDFDDEDDADEEYEILPKSYFEPTPPKPVKPPRMNNQNNNMVKRQQSFMPPKLGNGFQRPQIVKKRQSLMPDLFFNDRWNDLSNEISQDER